MKRRDFIKRAAPAATLPFLVSGFSLRAYGRSPFLESLVASATATDRVLVIVQMNGGNDGLNTVIPLDQYTALNAARSNILITDTKVLKLTNATGLHPGMTGLQSLYINGKLSVIQSVGYPNPNFSHFRATDIWLTGSDYNQIFSSGWMGRYLDEEFPDYPNAYPSAVMPDPLAIQISSIVSTGLQGPAVTMGVAITNPNSTYMSPGASDDPVPNTPAGHELTFLRQVAEQTQQYTVSVKAAAGKAKNLSTLYPAAGQNSLADQLKIVAQLVAGGLKTRIYVVNIGGFDTHSSQVASTAASDTGSHATLLGRLSVAITAFQDDLRLLGIENRVVGLTFSEFGRRIKSNASLGTDHGTAAPVFIFGTNVQQGIFGNNPALTKSDGSLNDNIPMQFDFRSVYASILKDWFGTAQSELQNVLQTPLFNVTTAQMPAIIKPSAVTGTDEGKAVPREFSLSQNYPNPFNPSTSIQYALPRGAHVRLEVFNSAGERVAVLVDNDQSAGQHGVTFDGTRLASGAYFYRLQAADFVATKKFLLIK